uniref:uncharacterized protein LOC122584834 n=1 Tax=Erigeron canadensis TaxID=72917 RepID=UPI001CB9C763|nr:uncharacterized protein LOC122584834 [Erigeron canadensis]
MEVEKASSKGGFLQLFDWNVKSRKKLFSNKPESSIQGKENLHNMALSRMQQMKKLHESIDDGPSLTGSDWASSSMSNDDASGTKAPGVVARLMGLDSLPTLDATSNPGFTSFTDSHSFRHSHITNDFEDEHDSMDYGMRNKLDGFSRNPVQDRLRKLQNRPIERFQSEVLPPRSAKSVPITHHRMLSPIKSPGFILSRNAAYIMEEASRIIGQSPQSNLNGSRSSSIPLRIRDLKDKMEAAQRSSSSEAQQQRPKTYSPVKSQQPRDKRQCRSEIVILKHGVAGSLKNKNKSISPATPVKMNVQKAEGTTSRNSRNAMNQKDDGVKSVQLDNRQRNTPKKVPNRSTTGRISSQVLTHNNQKQNCASYKDRTNLKPRVPYQHDRKTTSTNDSCRDVKTSKKTVEKSVVGARKAQLATTSGTGKESFSTTKKFSGKKRPTEGDNIFDRATTNNVLIQEKERSVKCNITIDGSSNWEPVDRKNGMDVVSFTFTSPIKKPVSESESSSGQSGAKSRGVCLKFQDDVDTGDSQFPSFGTPVIDSDALSVLLEQKLRELSSLVQTTECDIVKGSSTLSSASEMPGSLMQKDKSVIQHDSDVSSLIEHTPLKVNMEWQGVQVTECETSSENYESGMKHQYQNPCTSPSLEPSLSDDSCVTSNSLITLTSDGNKQYMSARNMELFAEEIELQDSATSFPSTIFNFTSMARWSSQWQLEYIREVLNYAVDDFAFSQTQKVINVNLFDQLESQNKYMGPFMKLQRKALFDCVSLCLEARYERAFSGSYEEWAKWSMMFKKKNLLAAEIEMEIRSWTNMEDLDVDEVVEKDMSSGNGKWLDFKVEALEEGVVIETDILTLLMDEIVADFLSC